MISTSTAGPSLRQRYSPQGCDRRIEEKLGTAIISQTREKIEVCSRRVCLDHMIEHSSSTHRYNSSAHSHRRSAHFTASTRLLFVIGMYLEYVNVFETIQKCSSILKPHIAVCYLVHFFPDDLRIQRGKGCVEKGRGKKPRRRGTQTFKSF